MWALTDYSQFPRIIAIHPCPCSAVSAGCPEASHSGYCSTLLLRNSGEWSRWRGKIVCCHTLACTTVQIVLMLLHFDSLTLRDEFNPLNVKEKKRSIVLVSLSPDPLPTGLETVDSSSDQDVTSGDLKNSSCLDMPRKTN